MEAYSIFQSNNQRHRNHLTQTTEENDRRRNSYTWTRKPIRRQSFQNIIKPQNNILRLHISSSSAKVRWIINKRPKTSRNKQKTQHKNPSHQITFQNATNNQKRIKTVIKLVAPSNPAKWSENIRIVINLNQHKSNITTQWWINSSLFWIINHSRSFWDVLPQLQRCLL